MARFFLLCFVVALQAGQATDDAVCMLQNTAAASGEATNDKPFDPFWWLSHNAKHTKAVEAPGQQVKTEAALQTPQTPQTPATAAASPLQTPAAAPQVQVEALRSPEDPQVVEVSKEMVPEVQVLQGSGSVASGAHVVAHRAHAARKYGATYPGGPTLAVRQRLQKERLAAKQKRKAELKQKWHQRQEREKREELQKLSVKKHKHGPAEMDLRAKQEQLQRREARKQKAEARTREAAKAAKKLENEKRKAEYQARAEQQHWERMAKERKAARAAKAKMQAKAKAASLEELAQ